MELFLNYSLYFIAIVACLVPIFGLVLGPGAILKTIVVTFLSTSIEFLMGKSAKSTK